MDCRIVGALLDFGQEREPEGPARVVFPVVIVCGVLAPAPVVGCAPHLEPGQQVRLGARRELADERLEYLLGVWRVLVGRHW